VSLNLNIPAWLPFNFLLLSWRIDPRPRDISKELKAAVILVGWRREREIELDEWTRNGGDFPEGSETVTIVFDAEHKMSIQLGISAGVLETN
jgi:hypothetical protein